MRVVQTAVLCYERLRNNASRGGTLLFLLISRTRLDVGVVQTYVRRIAFFAFATQQTYDKFFWYSHDVIGV